MRRLAVAMAWGCAVWAAAQSAGGVNEQNPGSLWNATSRNSFMDRTARRAGDLLTVLIREVSSSSIAAKTSTSKTDSNVITKALGPLLGALIPALSTGATGKSDGDGSTTQTGNLTARMTVVVKQVLPNGNLVIEGTRWVRVNKETQAFTLTGIVRRDDVRSDNTVYSENVAEADIKANGTGAIADRQRRGILTRLLDWLF